MQLDVRSLAEAEWGRTPLLQQPNQTPMSYHIKVQQVSLAEVLGAHNSV